MTIDFATAASSAVATADAPAKRRTTRRIAPAIDRDEDTSEAQAQPTTPAMSEARINAILAGLNGFLAFEFTWFGKRSARALRKQFDETFPFERMQDVSEVDLPATARLMDATDGEAIPVVLRDGTVLLYRDGADAFVTLAPDERCPRCDRPLYVTDAWRAEFAGHCSFSCRVGSLQGELHQDVLRWINNFWSSKWGPDSGLAGYRPSYNPGCEDEEAMRQEVLAFEGVDWATTLRLERETPDMLGVVALIDGALLLQNGCRPWRPVYRFHAERELAAAVAQAEREDAMDADELSALYAIERLQARG